MEYRYKAVNKENEVIESTEIADDKFELANYLKRRGLSLIEAEEISKKKFFDFSKIKTIGSISMTEKIGFAKNISSMIEAGLSLSRALSVSEKQSKNPKLKKVIAGIKEEIKKGGTFSDALKKHSKTFDTLFISMVKTGEESGNLVESLAEVGSQMEKTYTLKKKIKGALIYPGVIVTAMIGIGIFMMIYIVPTLTATFEDIGSELPASTKFVIGVSDFFNNNLLLGILIILVLFVVLYLMYKSKGGKRVIDFVFLKTPGISKLVIETNSARTTRTLSSLLKAGVPYLDAIEITKGTISNSYYIDVMGKIQKQVEMGLPISKVFEENSKLYPPFVAEMTAVGEETGDISSMLLKVAEFYEKEVDNKTKNLSTIVEPVLMIIVGAAVGFFAISMISPMYSLVSEF